VRGLKMFDEIKKIAKAYNIDESRIDNWITTAKNILGNNATDIAIESMLKAKILREVALKNGVLGSNGIEHIFVVLYKSQIKEIMSNGNELKLYSMLVIYKDNDKSNFGLITVFNNNVDTTYNLFNVGFGYKASLLKSKKGVGTINKFVLNNDVITNINDANISNLNEFIKGKINDIINNKYDGLYYSKMNFEMFIDKTIVIDARIIDSRSGNKNDGSVYAIMNVEDNEFFEFKQPVQDIQNCLLPVWCDYEDFKMYGGIGSRVVLFGNIIKPKNGVMSNGSKYIFSVIGIIPIEIYKPVDINEINNDGGKKFSFN
jgi:hypothetical protein